MLAKQFIVLGKLWVLLLFGNLALANMVLPIDKVQQCKTVTLFETEDSIHKEGLQPQIPSVRILTEHQSKPISFGYPELIYEVNVDLVKGFTGLTQVLIQDANRCESVSRFLFSYHFFW